MTASVCAGQSLGLVKGLLASTDCHVRALSQIGYGAISAPDSQFPLILTMLLTISVAVFGLRLTLGLSPLRIGDMALTAVKFGIVLALATSWPLYQRLVLDVLFHGPDQIGASLLVRLHYTGFGAGHDPFDGLQHAYDQMQAAAALFRQAAQGHASVSLDVASAAQSLAISSWVVLFANLGSVLVAKIILGVLTALGPLFAGLLLFEATRGMFEGWVRAMLVFSVMPLVINLALVLQLILLEPHLTALASQLPGEPPNVAEATSVLILSIVSAIAAVAAAGATLSIAMGLRLRIRRDAAKPDAGAPQTTRLSETMLDINVDRRIAAIGAAASLRDRSDIRPDIAAPRSALLARAGIALPDSGVPATDMLHRPRAQPRRTGGSARRDT
jgi:type IV secretion system protein VirB6